MLTVFLKYSRVSKIITSFVLVNFILSGISLRNYAWANADKLRPNAAVDSGEIENDFKNTATHLKKNLGANSVLGISAALVRQAAEAQNMPLYEFIARNLGNQSGREFTPQDYLKAVQAVNPIMNVMNGGAHGNWVTDIQEFMLAVGFGEEMPFSQRMEMANKVVAALTEIFKSPKELTRILGRQITEPFPVSVGDEGGYTPILKGNEEALKLLTAAIEKAGLTGKVALAIDAAITELYDEDTEKYNLKTDNRSLTRKEWADQLEKWVKNYKIVSTEDIFAENDWQGWQEGFNRIGDKVLIIGDDLTVTNIELLKKAIAEEAINSILIKINQNGSISGTLEVIQYALLHGVTVAISHRSGETEDTFISHLVVAANLFEKKANPKTGKMPMVLLKTGGFKRSDRIAKYNEILRIEAELERKIKGLAPELNQAGLPAKTIIDVYAVEIYDSRGNPTVESVITLNDGTVTRNAVPSGASTGSRESIELRDGVIAKENPERITQDFINKMFPGKTMEEVKSILSSRVGGKGVKFAVYNVNFLIAPLIIAKNPDMSKVDSLVALTRLDNLMLDLELRLSKRATGEISAELEQVAKHLKKILGANAVLGVSAALVREAAEAQNMPLYEYIARKLGNQSGREFTPEDYLQAVRAVNPIMNVMNGGAHGNWVTDIQEFMLAVGFGEEMPFNQRMEMGNKVVAALTDIFKSPQELTRILGRQIDKPFPVSVGDEGGYTPELKGNEEALKLLTAAIKKADLTGKVVLAIDAAITELYDGKTGKYNLKTDNRSLTGTEWTNQIEKWIDDYGIVSTEDIYAEDHWQGWQEGFQRFGDKVLIIGDDLTVTNIELLKKAIAEEAINSILIKINQNGSISGTLEVIQYALLHGVTVAISHRSGETEDTFISHLVVASNLFEKKANPKTGKMPMVLLKTGGFKRSDRIAKYNEILRIEADLERRIKGLVPELNQAGLPAKAIVDVYAVEIYDSRGNPTVESVITLNDGTVTRNAVPSGASTGSRESIELRDGVIAKEDPERITQDFINKMFPGKSMEEVKSILSSRVGGKGVKFAVYNVNFLIAPLITAKHPDMSKVSSLADLTKLDNIMFGLELKFAKIPGFLPYIQSENTVYSVSGGSYFDKFVTEVLAQAWEKSQKPVLKVSIEKKSDNVAQVVWTFAGKTVRKNFSLKETAGLTVDEFNKQIAPLFEKNNYDLTKEADFQGVLGVLEDLPGVSLTTILFVKNEMLPQIKEELLASKGIQKIDGRTRVFLVTPQVFAKGGMQNILAKTAELDEITNIKFAFYGVNPKEIRDILEVPEKNIITSENLPELLKELENRNIASANVVALITPEEQDEDGTVLSRANIRQIVTPGLNTLGAAKAIKELLAGFDFVKPAFHNFISGILLGENKIIGTISAYDHGKVIKELDENVFSFSGNLQPVQEVSEAIQEAVNYEQYKKFVGKYL